MKKILLFAAFIFTAIVAEAQTYQETVNWLSENVSMECFTGYDATYINEELKSIGCDVSSLKIETEVTGKGYGNNIYIR